MNRMRLLRALAWVCAASVWTGAAPAPVARSVLDLQSNRATSTIVLASGRTMRLVNLAPTTGRWYLLMLDPGSPGEVSYHLEVAEALREPLSVDASAGGRIVLQTQAGAQCVISMPDLDSAHRRGGAFSPLCDGRLFVRNRVRGRRTAIEATTEFLRDHVWGGERIIGFVRHQFYQDAFILRGAAAASRPPGTPSSTLPVPRLRPGTGDRRVVPTDLGIDIGDAAHGMRVGAWVPARGRPGVFVTVLVAAAVDGGARAPGHPAWQPDDVEAEALDYFVAFDLSRFDVGFALGTEHPRLGWSGHTAPAMLDADLPGPDGIATASPLVRVGMLNPADVPRAVATFTGGFKREHGAFMHGPLATVNHSSHYGFVEQGVVFSTLQPGLSTLTVASDGRVDIRTWQASDESRLPALRFARQNGAPLVESTTGGTAALGAFVDLWGPGNWSGSADERLRTLRAGACILEQGQDRYLVYGYFSAATPGTMARVFLSLGCRDAMHLDMNALEHTYLAVYGRAVDRLEVQHLVTGMSVLDQESGGRIAPRFIAFPDDRDFFYVLEKPATHRSR